MQSQANLETNGNFNANLDKKKHKENSWKISLAAFFGLQRPSHEPFKLPDAAAEALGHGGLIEPKVGGSATVYTSYIHTREMRENWAKKVSPISVVATDCGA